MDKKAVYQVYLEDVVRNYDFGNKNGFLFCLFETISNALYCSTNNSDINITVKLTREYKANELSNEDHSVITSVSVTDNGIGFNDENYDNFTKKIYRTNHESGKGLGRVSFLKVFKNVMIDSFYEDNGNVYHRSFKFDTSPIKDTKRKIENIRKPETTIYLKNIKYEYRDYSKKNIDFLTDQILNHFYTHLYYLMDKKKKFEIKIIDDSGKIADRVINNKKLKKDKVTKDKFEIIDTSAFEGMGTVSFDILHIKTQNIEGNCAYYVVDERSAGTVPKLDLPPCVLKDAEGNTFYYFVYLKSVFFNSFLNESRTELTLPTENKNPDKRFFAEEKIIEHLQEKVNKFLEYELSILENETIKKINTALTEEKNNKISNNKSYLYILENEETKSQLLKKIKFGDKERDILNKTRSFHEALQDETIRQVNNIVEKLKVEKDANEDDVDYEKIEAELQTLLQKVNMENSVNLSSYIMYRKYVLDLFYQGLEFYKKSKKYNEAFFHNLLMPKKTNNTKDSNLWMLDDLFLYFEGTSEIPISEIVILGQKAIRKLNEQETKMLNEFDKKRMERRIDLLFFPEEKQCIIIELKDPKVDLANGVVQMDRYAKQLANFIKPELSIEHIYTYLITDNFNDYDHPGHGFRKIYGIEGFVRPSSDISSYEGERKIADQYAEVIRYTDIYKRAKNRHKIYMEKLNIKG